MILSSGRDSIYILCLIERFNGEFRMAVRGENTSGFYPVTYTLNT